jgi:hypothetical protein
MLAVHEPRNGHKNAGAIEAQEHWLEPGWSGRHPTVFRASRTNASCLRRNARSSHAQQTPVMLTLNRRETRRKESDLLRSLAGYQAQPKFTHLANVRWIRKLPADTAAQWITGITLARELPKVGKLTLAIEQDAAEVLHMGDYGYSCLGTGSCNQYSALTNAMEANKQVVYARNSAGRVVGRQLLVISEEMKLVCFCVYPLNASEELRDLFGDFDCAFAEALKLPVETGDDYTVAAPLGLDWYDDGSWDPTPDTAE